MALFNFMTYTTPINANLLGIQVALAFALEPGKPRKKSQQADLYVFKERIVAELLKPELIRPSSQTKAKPCNAKYSLLNHTLIWSILNGLMEHYSEQKHHSNTEGNTTYIIAL